MYKTKRKKEMEKQELEKKNMFTSMDKAYHACVQGMSRGEKEDMSSPLIN
jgi:hypothetical protein